MPSDAAPIVTIANGAVRGVVVDSGYCFRGLPFAAPPTGELRWRAPRPPAGWQGVRDGTRFGPSSPQPANPALTGPTSEDCLYLNVYTPVLGSSGGGGLPVLVWHGPCRGAVARAAASAGRDGLRRQAPLRVLGRRVTPPGTARHTVLSARAS